MSAVQLSGDPPQLVGLDASGLNVERLLHLDVRIAGGVGCALGQLGGVGDRGDLDDVGVRGGRGLDVLEPIGVVAELLSDVVLHGVRLHDVQRRVDVALGVEFR